MVWCQLGSPPSCNLNGYLVFTGEANAQLSLSHLMMLGTSSSTTSLRPGQVTIPSSPVGFVCTRFRYLSGVQASQYWFAWRQWLCFAHVQLALLGSNCSILQGCCRLCVNQPMKAEQTHVHFKSK